MIWSDRIYHLSGDMITLEGMPSSLVVYLRELLVWHSIQNPGKNMMLMIRGYENQRNMRSKPTFKGYIKV